MLKIRPIAMIDDDQFSRSSLLALIRSFDFPVRAYPSADSFLAETTTNWSCVISDVRMPGISGFELLSALRRRLDRPPMILMTAYVTPGIRERAFAAGASFFLEKPVDGHLLHGCLRGILEGTPDPRPSERG